MEKGAEHVATRPSLSIPAVTLGGQPQVIVPKTTERSICAVISADSHAAPQASTPSEKNRRTRGKTCARYACPSFEWRHCSRW